MCESNERNGKILGEYFSYYKKLDQEMNFQCHIVTIKNSLRLQRMRKEMFGSLNIWQFPKQFTYLLQLCNIRNINQLNLLQKKFMWSKNDPKIKHIQHFQTNRTDGFKRVEVFVKVIILHCSWKKILFHEIFYDWKTISAYIIRKKFWENFKFHPNLESNDQV